MAQVKTRLHLSFSHGSLSLGVADEESCRSLSHLALLSWFFSSKYVCLQSRMPLMSQGLGESCQLWVWFHCRPGTSCETCNVASIKHQSGYLTDQLWDRRLAHLEFWNCERSQTLPVGSKASFPFRSSASEVRAKRPIDARAPGHQCSTDAKVCRVCNSFGRAGKPTIVPQMGRKDKRAQLRWLGTAVTSHTASPRHAYTPVMSMVQKDVGLQVLTAPRAISQQTHR